MVNESEVNDGERRAQLESLNREKAIVALPVIIYLCLVFLVGIIGNSLVVYVYHYRLRRSPSRYFIIFLAIQDLISCSLGCPIEIVDLAEPYIFTATWACKIMRFVTSVTIISSCFILICVSFDRFYKICNPLKGFPIRKVKVLFLCLMCLSVLLSWPAFVVFGKKTVETEISGLNGTECSTSDGIVGTIYPIVYYTFLFICYLLLLIIFGFFYTRIGYEIFKRKRLSLRDSLPAGMRNVNNGNAKHSNRLSIDELDLSAVSSQTEEHSKETSSRKISDETILGPNQKCQIHKRTTSLDALKNLKTKISFSRMSVRTVRTTAVFFAVTVAFVVSFMPYLIANILKFRKLGFTDTSDHSIYVVYNFCVRSYFVSSLINPIIYGAMNRSFRKECKLTFRRIFQKMCFCSRICDDQHQM
ncbi:hypothetical protein CHS0354_029079 [Potamilus streckersoni]|uniref:G-protein coupled receptors family 1 profile domain-containing protein n=1 Tax=Potamilus streckersoni TaxID=2493646 RepID=A0AAE0W2G4_9BIVA|nr:hypothetical protein CHS0354_029079 [Potamilus streckersoni]